MSSVSLGTLSVSEAEALLAQIWLRLEESGVETPELRCVFIADGTVSLWLASRDPACAAVCARFAVRWHGAKVGS